MPPLELDYWHRRAYSRSAMYVLAAVVAFAAFVAGQYWWWRADIVLKEARLSASMTKPLQRPAAVQRVNAEEYAFARDTIRRLSTPWGPLFRALEAVNRDRIALLAIEPNVESRTVTVSGEAKDYLAVLTYLAQLSDQDALKRVHLVRHEVRQDGSRRPVAFTISAGWKEEL